MSQEDTKVQGGYLLRLFVSGSTPRSSQAIAQIKAICEEYLADDYELEIVDLYQQPGIAKENQVIAAPTLIKERPFPTRKVIGDMSDIERILNGLQINREEQ